MSAPTRDPLVVSTQDGMTWVRRAVKRDGHGLYVMAGTPQCCPEFVMATLRELAEHGLRGMADALPMPVGSERSPLDQAHDDLAGANLSLWEEEQETARLRLALKSAQRGRRGLRARAAELEAAPTTVFRASHESIVMGLYTTAAEARKHCETAARREHAETSKVELWWREDEDTVDQPEDGEQELFEHVKLRALPGPGRTRNTGYMVTPLEVVSEYDAEADE